MAFRGECGSECHTAWVKTKRLEAELARKRPFVKLGDLHGVTGLGLLGADAARERCGLTSAASVGQTANTALQWFAGRLLALNEGDVPVSLRLFRNGAVETLTDDSNHLPAHSKFTAHPKMCPVSGELHSFGYRVDAQPWLTYRVQDKTGALVHSTEVFGLRAAVMMHDFALTASRVLFLDCPLRFQPSVMVSKDCLPFVYAKEYGTRIGLLQRRAAGDAVRWFTLPSACMIFHTLCAYDDGPVVRLFACRMEDFSLDLPSCASPGSFDPRSVDGGSPSLFEFVLDTHSGEATQREVVSLPAGVTGMDFPTAHPQMVGMPLRYGYLAMFSGLLVTGVAKVDIQAGMIAKRLDFPEGTSGGECVFAPRLLAAPSSETEDDGFLLTVVSTLSASQVWVIDARVLTTVAVLNLPSRVPWGFHGTWVNAAAVDAAEAARATTTSICAAPHALES